MKFTQSVCVGVCVYTQQNRVSEIWLVLSHSEAEGYSSLIKKSLRGSWVAQWVEPLPSAQVMISESWDPACVGLSTQQGACFPLSLSNK